MTKLLPFTIRDLVVRIIRFDKSDVGMLKKQKEALSNADLVVFVSQNIANWYGIKAEIIPRIKLF